MFTGKNYQHNIKQEEGDKITVTLPSINQEPASIAIPVHKTILR